MTDDEIALAKDDLFEVPAIGLLVAVVFNVPVVSALQLSRATIAKMFK